MLAFVVLQDIADDIRRLFGFFWRRVERDADLGDAAYVGAAADVFDVAAGHVFVGDDGGVAGEQTEFCGAESDFLDDAVVVFDDNAFADAVRFVENDHHRAEQVLEGILSGESDRQTADARPGEQGRQGDTEIRASFKKDNQGDAEADDFEDTDFNDT